MENAGELKQDAHRLLNKTRLVGRLFGRGSKVTRNGDGDEGIPISRDSTSDKLYMLDDMPVDSPALRKLDMSNVSRLPSNEEGRHLRHNPRGRSVSPKRTRKGLFVHFTDQQPEIIGHGGDETEEPPCQIAVLRKRAHSHPTISTQRTVNAIAQGEYIDTYSGRTTASDTFRPQPVRRIQTGHMSSTESTRDATREIHVRNDHEHGLTQTLVASGDNNLFNSFKSSLSNSADHSSLDPRMQLKNSEGGSESREPKSQASIERGSSLKSNLPLQIGSAPNMRPNPPSPSSLDRNEDVQSRQMSNATALESDIAPKGNFRDDIEGLGGTKIHPRVVPTVLLHADLKSNDDAFDVFYARVRHLFKLFLLSAESIIPLSRTSCEDLMTAASWWFLKGRAQIEQAAQGRPSSANGQFHMNVLIQQAHIDLAKSLWIILDVLPSRPEIAHHKYSIVHGSIPIEHSADDNHKPKLAEGLQIIQGGLRKLTLSMRRNGLLPTNVEDALLSSGMDLAIWIAHPSSIPEIYVLFSGLSSLLVSPQINTMETMPIGDTAESFVYGRMFVDFYLAGAGVDLPQYRCPCILSICRKRSEKNIMFTVASQNSLIALSIHSGMTRSPSWHDVQWHANVTSLEIKLSASITAHIRFSPGDYRTLWNMYDSTSRTYAHLHAEKDEVVVFKDTIKSLQYFTHDNRASFPRESCPDCHVLVFEKISTERVSGSSYTKHRGFRIAATTNVNTKKVSGLSCDLSSRDPLRYNFVRLERDLQGIVLGFDGGARQTTLVLGFRDVQSRSKFHDSLVGWPCSMEPVLAHIALEEICLQDATDLNSMLRFPFSAASRKPEVWIIRDYSRDHSDAGKARQSHFHNLRLLVGLQEGFMNDRVGLELGDLQLCLSTEPDVHTLAILRRPQVDMTLSIAESDPLCDTSKGMRRALQMIENNETIRTYRFSSLDDLHIFQTAISGFSVAFDGVATSFAISRRRMVVPIHKKWEASSTRLQVLKQEKSYQLVAFFDGFSHGRCMNFALKATDTFESFSKTSLFAIRLVDAKFALPRCSGDDHNDNTRLRSDQGFVCLDEPDYPTEHDDITISFALEAERDRFVEVLPAPVKMVSRIGTVRR